MSSYKILYITRKYLLYFTLLFYLNEAFINYLIRWILSLYTVIRLHITDTTIQLYINISTPHYNNYISTILLSLMCVCMGLYKNILYLNVITPAPEQ